MDVVGGGVSAYPAKFRLNKPYMLEVQYKVYCPYSKVDLSWEVMQYSLGYFENKIL